MSPKAFIAFLVGALAAAVPLSSAQAVVAAAPPGAAGSGYATQTVVTATGGVVEFVNLDLDAHNLIAYQEYLPKKEAKTQPWCSGYKKTKCPLFWSETIGPGETQVQGLEDIEPGDYAFFCSVHPSMKGTLQVL